MKKNNNYSFLLVGQTQESTETSEGGFKRYIGIGSSRILGFNPKKVQLDEWRGFESANEPEYIRDGENGKEVIVSFVVRTDPDTNNGIEITNTVNFHLRNEPAISQEGSTVQVIDRYGNNARVPLEDAKAGKALGPNMKIDQTHYRMAIRGEVDLVTFLKTFLNIPASLDYQNGTWTLKKDAQKGQFGFEHIENLFKGDFTEIQEALNYQPNNKIKLLYGVRTKDGKQYQAIAERADFFLRNNANASAIARLEKSLIDAKNRNQYQDTEFKIQELAEYTVEPTNLDQPAASADTSSNSGMPW